MRKLLVLLAMFAAINASGQWVKMASGFSTNKYVWSMAAKGDTIFAGTNDGVYISVNNGANWSLTNLNQAGDFLLIDGNNVIAGTSFGVYRTTNNGQNWSLLGISNRSVWAIAKKDNNIFAGTTGYGVYRSTDNGVNWEISLQKTTQISSLTIKDNYIFAGDWMSPTIYVSSNNGSTWDSTSLGGPFTRVVLSLAVKGSIVFAGTDNYGIFYTTNNGINWTQSSLSEPSVICINVNGNNIFAGTAFALPGGVFLSTNNGTSWIIKNQGMGNRYIWSMTSNSQYIFAGTDSTIWRHSLSEIIGIQNISTEIPSSYSLGQNYPNPFNPITVISFSLPVVSNATLKVYDLMGREVQTLVNEKLQAGTYEVTFDGSGLTSGVYFYKLMTEGFSETKRMLLIK